MYRYININQNRVNYTTYNAGTASLCNQIAKITLQPQKKLRREFYESYFSILI